MAVSFSSMKLSYQPNPVKLHHIVCYCLNCLIACLQYAKMEGKALSCVSVYLGRQRGERSPIERMHFSHTFFILNQERYLFCFANV